MYLVMVYGAGLFPKLHYIYTHEVTPYRTTELFLLSPSLSGVYFQTLKHGAHMITLRYTGEI